MKHFDNLKIEILEYFPKKITYQVWQKFFTGLN